MKLTTALAGFDEKIKTSPDGKAIYYAREVIIQLLSFTAGALFASINDLGTFSPFGVAAAACAKPKYLISAGLGAAAGYILTQDSVSALRYIAALVSAAVLSRLTLEFERIKKFRFLPSCIAFLTCFLSSAAVMLAGKTEIKAFLIYLGEALTAAAAAYFFAGAHGALSQRKEQNGFTVRDLSSLLISAYLLLLSVSGITLFRVSPARIAAVMIILIFSYAYKEAGGALAGISAGLVFAISESTGSLAAAYAAAGLFAGVFSYSNRFVCAGTFLAGFGAAFLFGGGETDKIYLIIEAAAASAAFMIIPKEKLVKLESLLTVKKEGESAKSQRQTVLNRLKAASSAVESVSRSVQAVSDAEKKADSADSMLVYTRVRDEVCKGCRLSDFCWNKNFADCRAAFDVMRETVKNGGTAAAQNAPKFLSGCCVRLEKLTSCFNRQYTDYVFTRASDERVEKVREVTAQQFTGICGMLTELSAEFSKETFFDDDRAQRTEEALLNEFSLAPESVVCMTDEHNKLRIEIRLAEKLSDVSEEQLRLSLVSACGRELELPSVDEAGRGAVICFCEKTRYRVAVSAAKITADDEKLCGDSFESFYDGRGNYVIVLSDGMGTGMRAAVDSSLASSMTARLLRSGFSYPSAFELVNSAMLLKSCEESLATLDVVCINLYTGKAHFYKAGAAPSFIKRKSSIIEIERASMPIGILRRTDIVREDRTLRENDLVVLASDGAFEYSGEALKNGLAVTLNEDVRDVAERLALKAKHEKKNSRCDDITVIALRLLENK